MKIGIMGTGKMGEMLGRKWAEAGHDVMFGSREAARGQSVAEQIGHGATGGTIVEAAEFCEAAVLAFPWYAFVDVERAVEERLDGKIVIDCINPLKSSGSLAIGHKQSAGEEIAKTWHRAHVVKTLNHIHYKTLQDPLYEGKPVTALYCSNSDKGKAAVVSLLQDLRLEPMDAGTIKNARLLEPLGALWIQLAFHINHDPSLAIRVVTKTE